jgi:hypothetical protein
VYSIIYRAYLASKGADVGIVDDIRKCLERIFSPTDEGFEVVIIDRYKPAKIVDPQLLN